MGLGIVEEGVREFKAGSLKLQTQFFVIRVFMQHLHRDGKDISSHVSVLSDSGVAWSAVVRSMRLHLCPAGENVMEN